jgi:hypothetical protein
MPATKVQRRNDECAYVIPRRKDAEQSRAGWSVTRYLARSFKFVGGPSLRSDDSENQPTSRAALTLRMRSFSFFPSRQGSSVVEQGTHKPLVGSSNLPPGIFIRGLLHELSIGRSALGIRCFSLDKSPLLFRLRKIRL